MNRITDTLKARGRRKLLIPFFTVGYPDISGSRRLIEAAVAAGADMVELGLPFSDPIADGPAIQYSSHVALEQGGGLRATLDVAQAVRRKHDTPILIMSYLNPLMAVGLEGFCRRAHEAGVDGLILPDLPVDEFSLVAGPAASFGLSLVGMVAPTSDLDRIRRIDRHTTDFVYAVTVTGVTGARRRFTPETAAYLRRLRRMLRHPFVAGFGVSSPETARQTGRYADGVVVGSALIEEVKRSRSTADGVRRVERLLGRIRRALD